MAAALVAGGTARGDRVGIWAPNCAEWTSSSTPPRASGPILVNDQPGVPHPRAGLRAQPGRHAAAGLRRRASRPATTARWSTRSATECPALRAASSSAARTGTTCWRRAATSTPSDAGGARGRRCRRDDPINIQYTSGTTGFPKGATLSAPQHPQQRLLRRRGLPATPSEDRICIPVPFYHCFGMVMGNLGGHHARRHDGDPRARLRPRGDARGGRAGALHRAVRRAHDVHRRAGRCRDFASYDLSSLRTGIMAGSPCPVEVMKQAASSAWAWPR